MSPSVRQPAGAAKPGVSTGASGGKFEVTLPAGGTIEVKDAREQEFWDELRDRYIEDYGIVRTNDLMQLGAILSQSLHQYRHQLDLNDPKKAPKAISEISKASEQIRELEKALGIDKKTREAGGQHTVIDFLTRAKAAAESMGLRISDRVLEHEDFAAELSWRLRVLRNGDASDRRHHGVTEQAILEFCESRLAEIESRDQEWAREEGAVFVGTL